MPKKIISTGGIVSLPVCFSAFILRVPIILYELNAVPGKAIKLLAPIAQNIFVCFKSTEKFFIQKKCKVINYPIKFLQKDKKIDKKTACKQLQLDPHKKTIAVLGGSQGSLFLNDCIKQWIHKTTLQAGQFQMIHQTGSNDSTDWQHFYQGQKITAHVFSFSYDIAKIYAAADVIICRAGAGTLFEILFFEKPCIVIPLKTHTTSHQIDNARTISQEYPHLFHLLLQDDIEKKPAILFSYLDQLINESATNKNKLSCINTLRLNLPFRSP